MQIAIFSTLGHRQDLRFPRLGNPPVRRLPMSSMDESLVARRTHPPKQAPGLTIHHLQHLPGLPLRDLLLPQLAEHMDSPQLFRTHRHRVLSDHPPPSKSGEAINEEDISILGNPDIIISGSHCARMACLTLGISMSDGLKGVTFNQKALLPSR